MNDNQVQSEPSSAPRSQTSFESAETQSVSSTANIQDYSASVHDKYRNNTQQEDRKPMKAELLPSDEGEGVRDEATNQVSNDISIRLTGEVADPEQQALSFELNETFKSTTIQREQANPDRVYWNGPQDPQNPKNWPYKRKIANTLVVTSFTLIPIMSSSMVAPALPQMNQDLGSIRSTVVSQMMLSVFLLAYAIAPLLFGPLSEVYGRVLVLQLTNLCFLVFNLACGFAHSTTQMIAFRFFAGLGASAPLAIGGGKLHA